MELFPSRGYFFCRYCGSFHFPETVGDDGVRVVAEGRGTGVCPICRKTLSSAMLDERHLVEYCVNCRGVLVSRSTFADVVRLRRAWATGPPGAPVPLSHAELQRRVECPRCAAPLETHPYFGPGNVVIDSCGACDVIWLDFGELKQIVDAPGSDRGGRERAALATADWSPDVLAVRPQMRGDSESGLSGRRDLLAMILELLD